MTKTAVQIDDVPIDQLRPDPGTRGRGFEFFGDARRF